MTIWVEIVCIPAVMTSCGTAPDAFPHMLCPYEVVTKHVAKHVRGGATWRHHAQKLSDIHLVALFWKYALTYSLKTAHLPMCLGQLVLTLPVCRSTVEVSGNEDWRWTHRGGARLCVISLCKLDTICYSCIINALHFYWNGL